MTVSVFAKTPITIGSALVELDAVQDPSYKLLLQEQVVQPTLGDHIRWEFSASPSVSYLSESEFALSAQVNFDLAGFERLERRQDQYKLLLQQNENRRNNSLFGREMSLLYQLCELSYLYDTITALDRVVSLTHDRNESLFWEAQVKVNEFRMQTLKRNIEEVLSRQDIFVGSMEDSCNTSSVLVLHPVQSLDFEQHPVVVRHALNNQNDFLLDKFANQPERGEAFVNSRLSLAERGSNFSISAGIRVPLDIGGTSSALIVQNDLSRISATVNVASVNFMDSPRILNVTQELDIVILHLIEEIISNDLRLAVAEARETLLWHQLTSTNFLRHNEYRAQGTCCQFDVTTINDKNFLLEVYLETLRASYEVRVSYLQAIELRGIRPSSLLISTLN